MKALYNLPENTRTGIMADTDNQGRLVVFSKVSSRRLVFRDEIHLQWWEKETPLTDAIKLFNQ